MEQDDGCTVGEIVVVTVVVIAPAAEPAGEYQSQQCADPGQSDQLPQHEVSLPAPRPPVLRDGRITSC
ncbi:hypothetical protein Pen02_52320 [Plantactinospora endophytica]|uniref:Uncharacterized protein n=1 Tax=Plantactinospora endophytica TaxID=673535 RepID=A0ABQ4E6F2_9ACTN|nr:hypothetical protein Pen02_52320 [Plantactinospora endophytica]